MRSIMLASKAIACNIREAREKICAAYEMRETDRPYADWLAAMAKAHIDFNAQGHTVVATRIGEAAKSGSELSAGMRVAYDAIHADMMRDQAEVAAMIASYGK